MSNSYNQEYPVDAFPPIMRNVISSLHEESQIPIELIGSTVLAAAALACQYAIEVIPPHSSEPEQCCLYLLSLADSGEGKSTINKKIMKPFRDFSVRMNDEYKSRMDEYEAEMEPWKMMRRTLASQLTRAIKEGGDGKKEQAAIKEHRKNGPRMPIRMKVIYEDATPKALLQGLRYNPIAGIVSDEAITFFKGYLKNNLGLLNKAWDGEAYDYERPEGGEFCINACLTISLMSQPGVFISYYKKHGQLAKDSGLFSRFLFTNSKSTRGDRNPNIQCNTSESSLKTLHDKITGILLSLKSDEALKLRQIKLSDEAKDAYSTKYKCREDMISSGNINSDVMDIFSKFGSNALRVAAIFHFMSGESSGYISKDNYLLAEKLISWHFLQADEIFYPLSDDFAFEKDVRELYYWLKNKFEQNSFSEIPQNYVQKCGPNRLRSLGKLTPVLHQLASIGLIGILQPGSGEKKYLALPTDYWNTQFSTTPSVFPMKNIIYVLTQENAKPTLPKERFSDLTKIIPQCFSMPLNRSFN